MNSCFNIFVIVTGCIDFFKMLFLQARKSQYYLLMKQSWNVWRKRGITGRKDYSV